ncbi:hypothetical protein OG756_15665 [Streptomyces sp. NBC_01310]|uniref:hypothetical protein n=1 Tax=Streptomyces sp. NBC_01310 TaxID=2903820 RepID=UPI0035B6776C|nr:hypothetical protein OG756_15665 [Streptomyces sp. NBC_01310]
MLTYENVMNAPLDKLQTAVTDWTATAGKLDEMAEAARNSMKVKSDKAKAAQGCACPWTARREAVTGIEPA